MLKVHLQDNSETSSNLVEQHLKLANGLTISCQTPREVAMTSILSSKHTFSNIRRVKRKRDSQLLSWVLTQLEKLALRTQATRALGVVKAVRANLIMTTTGK